LGAMTGGAGERIVLGEPGVVKEPAAKGDGSSGGRIAGWGRERRQPQRNVDGDRRSNRPGARRNIASAEEC